MSRSKKEYSQRYYLKNKEKIIARNFKYRQDPEYRAYLRGWYSQYRKKIRMEMIEAYGGGCSCCGEKEYDFLTLEHINHDGKAHRKQCSTGMGYVLDLRRRRWPKEGYTILCLNCNHATRLGAICPHKRQLEVINGN